MVVEPRSAHAFNPKRSAVRTPHAKGSTADGLGQETQLSPARGLGCSFHPSIRWALLAACCLSPRCRDGKLPVCTRCRAGAGDLPAFSPEAFLPPEQHPRGAEIRAQPSWCAGPRPTCARVICVPRVRTQLSQPLADLCCVVLREQGELGRSPPRAAAPAMGGCRLRGRWMGTPGSRGRGCARRQRQRRGWARSALPCAFLATGIRGGAREAPCAASLRGAEARSAGGGRAAHPGSWLIAGLLHERIISTVPVLNRSSSLRGHSYFPYHEKCKYYLGPIYHSRIRAALISNRRKPCAALGVEVTPVLMNQTQHRNTSGLLQKRSKHGCNHCNEIPSPSGLVV